MNIGWSRWLVGAASLAAVAVGCTQDFDAFQFQGSGGATASSTSTSSGMGECSTFDECPQGNDCKKASCVGGVCGFELQTAGAPCNDDGGKVCNDMGACVECIDGSACDASKPLCLDGKCAPGACMNGVKDGNETSIDCGGDCPKCVDGKDCLADKDCVTNFCKSNDPNKPNGPGKCAPCASNGDCAGDEFCKNKTTCTPKFDDGQACGDGDECKSSNCVDGVCCNSKCDGVCAACSAAKTGGKNGECAGVKKGEDPDKECDDTAASTCGPAVNKGCSGAIGSCELWDANTVCAAASCDPAKNEQLAASKCDGKGKCVAPNASSCGLYVCDGNNESCLKNCTGNNEAACALTSYCDTNTCKACGPVADPPGAMVCPAECSTCLGNKLCVKNCSGGNCANFVCPAGFDCLVNCAAPGACTNATITCQNKYACQVECAAQEACKGATIQATGVVGLSVHCTTDADSCKDANVKCGVNDCVAKCDGASKPAAISGCGNQPTDSCKCTVATCQ